MQRMWGLTLLGFVFAGAAVFAQTAERIDTIVEQDELRTGAAAYLAAAAAGIVSEDASEAEALAALEERGLGAERLDPEASVRLDRFSYMLMLANDMGGGVLYTVFPGPRYGFRELQHEGVFRAGGDPDHPISGTRALRVTGRVLSIAEERQAR